MATETDLVNLSYGLLGKGTPIGDIDEASAEARLAKLWLPFAKKAVLRDFHWPCATRIETGQLIEEDPTTEWGYSYQYPSDCLDLRRILSGIRNDDEESKVKYRRANINNRAVILTDQDEAVLEYTFDASVGFFTPDLVIVAAHRLGVYLAPKTISGESGRQMAVSLMSAYKIELAHAQMNAVLEDKRDTAPESTFVTARRGRRA